MASMETTTEENGMDANGATGHVLVIDDDESITDLLRMVLQRRGYEVEAANDAEEALARVRPGVRQVILCDVRMPGMDGLALAGRIRAIAPDARIVLMTGSTTGRIDEEAQNAGVMRVLYKPFKGLHEIFDAVRDALAGDPP